MSAPPNSYTTAPLWDLWRGADAAISSARFGGIYANKSGYHNTRNAHFTKAAKEQGWDDNYSVQLSLDKQGPGDKAAALDLTLSDADMKRYTARLRDAMEAGDPRMGSVKEFYGTLDGRKVFGLGKKSRGGKPYETSADSSHLWHIHLSFFRADVENRDRILGVLEVLTGTDAPEPTPSKPKPSTGGSDWTEEAIMSMPTIREGDRGRDVKRMQGLLHANGYTSSRIDGIAGPKTERDVMRFQVARNTRNSVSNGRGDGIVGRYTWTDLLGA